MASGGTKKRRVGSELVEFKHGEAQINYYCGTHEVDDDKNNRQGFSSLEEEFLSNDWIER